MPDIFVPEKNPSSAKATEGKGEEEKITFKKLRHIHHLASFCTRPFGINFQAQEEDEEILLILRKHFITNVPWIFFTIVFIILLPILSIINSRFLFIDLSFIPSRFITVFVIFYYLIVFNYLFINFITWFYNITIVTNKRIVDVDFSHLVYHDVAATKLNLIEEIRYAQTGFIRTFFNYGDLFIQTAGENPNVEALAFPKPNEAIQIIQNLIGKGPYAG